MKILQVHNFYQQPGGEDGVFAAEGQLLASRGNEVVRYTAHNDDVAKLGALSLARTSIWNGNVYREVREILRRERPAVMHVHNTLPLISPSVYYAAREEEVPVVQTLHNYRLLCLNATFFRKGTVCEECVGKAMPYPGVVHRCYRKSLAASGVVATTLAVHNALHTWSKKVDLFIALTEFARDKFVGAGLSPEMLMVKPNFVSPDPGPGVGDGEYALFVGRLTTEKGLRTLLAAWRSRRLRLPLRIVGDGPLSDLVATAAATTDAIEWLGQQPASRVAELIERATILVCPSEWYEGFPLVVVEAYAAGLPVIASDIGSFRSIVQSGVTGLRFPPGDVAALADCVEWIVTHPDELARMRSQARQRFESEYSADRNYEMLMRAYQTATTRAGSHCL